MISRMMVAAVTVSFAFAATEASACHFFKKRGGHSTPCVVTPVPVPCTPCDTLPPGATIISETPIHSGTIIGETTIHGGMGTTVTEAGKTTTETGKTTTETTEEGKPAAVSAEEKKWWDEMVKKEYVTADQYEVIWSGATPAARKEFYNNILKVEKDAEKKATEEAEKKAKEDEAKKPKE